MNSFFAILDYDVPGCVAREAALYTQHKTATKPVLENRVLPIGLLLANKT
jgi:hypothetical protein